MKKTALILLLSALCVRTEAAQINGGDWQGAPLEPANYDILRGTFTNVGNFFIAPGRTVMVAQGERLAVYAATVTISGHLNANGSGLPGGAAGGVNLPGADGFSQVDGGAGSGGSTDPGGDAAYGGGGGGHGGDGGPGEPDPEGGSGGAEYDLDNDVGIPLSPSDASMGSGGGGGGGGAPEGQSGGGGSGGGAIYIEAGYVVISGTVSADGLSGGVGITTDDVPELAAGGGGGSGGGILIKSAGLLDLSGGMLSSSGGSGGSAISVNVAPNPGGGGAAGRIRLVYNSSNFTGTVISTAGGLGGQSNFGGGTSAQDGALGTVSFGLFPSSPTAFTVTEIFASSAAFSWTGKAGGEWGGPLSGLPALTLWQFRLYSSTTALPLTSYYTGFQAGQGDTALTETGLSPNTEITRMLTAYTNFGYSAPSAPVSFKTRAASPQGQGFASASADTVVFQWSSGTVAEGFNPAGTGYEITRSTVPAFASAAHTTSTVNLSSAPAGLEPNTTYYFRARALGIDAAYTGYTQEFSTPTLAAAPASPELVSVFTSSIIFTWDGGQNPPGTLFEAQISSNDFINIGESSFTVVSTSTFADLTPGNIYSLRVRAINHAGRQTAFTAVISTTAGQGQSVSLEAPGRPEPPTPASRYSYDGTAVFSWAPPAGAGPIYEYLLDIGTSPGGNDFLSAQPVLASGPLSYAASALVSGKTYYARVRARSSAGVLGEFSQPGAGVAAWAPQTQPALTKPYNWPNPFNPRQAPTNIGFSLSTPARVTLTIYTLQGSRVREISAAESSAGNKVWSWDGRNGEGRLVEPGGYLAVIKKDYASGFETQRFKIAVLY